MSKRYHADIKSKRQNKTRHLRNKMERSRVKTLIKNVQANIKAGKKEECVKSFNIMSSALDKAVKHGLIHINKAARKKSRIAKKLAAIK